MDSRSHLGELDLRIAANIKLIPPITGRDLVEARGDVMTRHVFYP